MTTEEIYKLADELTEKEVNNVLAAWELEGETKSIDLFNSLVMLGDSKELAMATAISEQYKNKDNNDFYYNGYCI